MPPRFEIIRLRRRRHHRASPLNDFIPLKCRTRVGLVVLNVVVAKDALVVIILLATEGVRNENTRLIGSGDGGRLSGRVVFRVLRRWGGGGNTETRFLAGIIAGDLREDRAE